MALKYVVLADHPSGMTAEDLRAALGRQNDTQLVRSLIMAELAYIRAYDPRPIRTMRGLWYALIKPALSRLGRLNAKTKGGKGKDWDKTLSRALGELVSMGVTTYEEMSIVDGSRLKQTAVTITQPVIRVPVTGAHYPQVVICSEKDTIYTVIRQVAELYGVSCYSGGGQPSKAATENLVLDIVRSQAFTPDSGITVLSLTDYDPSGYSIANTFFAQVAESVTGLDYDFPIQHKRLGLEPDQLTPDELAQNVYELKDTGKEKAAWYALTGGVNGQPVGLELDALPIDRIRRMFADGIEREIDLAQRQHDLREAALDLLACEIIMPSFNSLRRALLAAAKQSPAWVGIQAARIPDDLFREAAVQGENSINPLDYDLFDLAAIQAIMRNTFEGAAA